jgi:uncharacterized cupin superfamily protein
LTYTRVDATEITPALGPRPAASRFDKGVGQALGVRAFGIYQVELASGAETVRHDHTDDGAEDVYAVLRGSGVVIVDDEEVPVEPGKFIAVTPESTRLVRAGAGGLVLSRSAQPGPDGGCSIP